MSRPLLGLLLIVGGLTIGAIGLSGLRSSQKAQKTSGVSQRPDPGSASNRALVPLASVDAFNSYHIGNSLTWDLQPLGLVEISAQRGTQQTVGHHIQCGQPLNSIWANPKDTCVNPVEAFGTFRPALEKHRWDAVTLQPYRGASTLGEDEKVILQMIELAQKNPDNAKTRFFIHAAWPGHRGKDYAKHWTREVKDEDDTPTDLCRSYFAHLLKRVRSKTDASVEIIPAGETLFALDQKLRSGALPGVASVEDLYRDEVHLSLDRGRFAVALTAFASITGSDPSGLTKPEKAYGKSEVFTEAYYKLVYETVRNVISNAK